MVGQPAAPPSQTGASARAAVPQGPATEWWGRRRLLYNLALILAGPLAFACQAAVVSWGTALGAIPPEPDPDALRTAAIVDGVAYLLVMGIANVCYFLGPWSERLIRPANAQRYRRLAFQLGFWFSVLLPFSIPARLAYFCSAHPDWRQFHG